MLRIRTTITNGDELALHNACERWGMSMEIGGVPDCDGWVDGFCRLQDEGLKGDRTDWMVVYLNVDRIERVTGIRTVFLESLELT